MIKMASLATFAAVQTPGTIKVIRGCSISGIKLHVKPSCQGMRTKTIRSGAVVGKYADKSVYFDLEDLGNTTGQWDLGLLLKFLILGGGLTLAYFSSMATGDIVPIKKGP